MSIDSYKCRSYNCRSKKKRGTFDGPNKPPYKCLHDNSSVHFVSLSQPRSMAVGSGTIAQLLGTLRRYGEAAEQRQIVKITSGDVMTRVPLRLSHRSLAFYYGKVSCFTYSSLREYKPTVYFSFQRFFHCLNSLVRR